MGNALGIQTCGLGIDPRSQNFKSFFLWLIVTVVQVKHSYLFQKDQLTQLRHKPIQQSKDS